MKFFHLPRLDWAGWQAEYRPGIRLGLTWDRLLDPEPVVTRHWFGPDGWSAQIYLPWYESGDWRDGRPQLVHPGPSDSILVLPAVRISERFVVLDGTHRLMSIRPRLVILDALNVLHRQQCAFIDLMNPEHRQEENECDRATGKNSHTSWPRNHMRSSTRENHGGGRSPTGSS